MRTPQVPPPTAEVLQRLSDPRVLAILAGHDHGTPYHHWEDTRYRKPPQELSREEWWAVIKAARLADSRRIPLADTAGRPFFYCLPDEVLRDNEFVSTQTGGGIGLGEDVANPAVRDQYLVNSLIEEAVTSSQLEGARTDKRVAQAMIRSGREPRDKSERMILNNFRAMEFVSEIRSEPLTPEIICQIQRIATEGTLDNPASAGRFQLPHEERVGVYDTEGNLLYRPPPAEVLPERIEQLCRFANTMDSGPYLPCAVRAIVIHFMLAYEHPFEDGNGRTARLLFYWSMLHHGYWLTEFISISSIIGRAPAKYGRAFLRTETDDNDLTYFILFHLRVLRTAIDELHTYLARKVTEVRELTGKLHNEAGHFNHRQLALLGDALKNPGASYSVQSHRTSHRVSAETARQDLLELEGNGFLEKSRMGKKFVYRPRANLAEKVRMFSGTHPEIG
ncbi:Fic family protein [Sinosporangium siamense]|uniref:Fic family protein n=1 Tax=Sinosporangium siamense TaxID=1367973 RepID=A0A919RJM4_9ACTN|nr:Fic family protein [Sinosporangium siamense]GII93114.1 Fic family protein [Sinosporangium siamense]